MQTPTGIFMVILALLACGPRSTEIRAGRSPLAPVVKPAPDAVPRPAGADVQAGKTKPCLGIVDGTATKDYPATYLLLATDGAGRVKESCTGTFVGDNVLITAAHCIPAAGAAGLVAVSNAGDVVKDKVDLKGSPHGLRVFMDASIKFGSDGPELDNTPMGKDFAVVLFAAGTAKNITPVARTTAPAGTAVTLVGYGANDTADTQGDNSPTVPKKFGFNTVATANKAYPWEGLYQVHAWAHPGDAQKHGAKTVSAAPGDSGGPMLKGDVMIGIVKYGFTTDEYLDIEKKTGTNALDFWVDVANPTAKEVLARAEAAGAHVTYEDQVKVPAPSAPAPAPAAPTPVIPVVVKGPGPIAAAEPQPAEPSLLPSPTSVLCR